MYDLISTKQDVTGVADKSALIYLLKYIYEQTDESHPANAADLQSILKKNGCATDRRTIRKYMLLLEEVGLDVVSGRQGKAWTYFYGGRTLEVPELRILIDAVSSAQFITQEKSNQLIEKLVRLANINDRADLKPAVHVAEHVKARNNQILYTLDRISEAIQKKKKISFQYYNYNTAKERILRHGGEVYVLSPYATLWQEDRYYVVGWSEKRKTVVPFRLDRMTVPELLDEDAEPEPASFNIQDYTDKFTRMYGGKEEQVTLRCRNTMIDKVIDKFGPEAHIFHVTESTFDVCATVAVGGTFLAWLLQYAGSMTILSPEPVRSMYREMMYISLLDLQRGNFNERERVWKLAGEKPG